MANNKDESKKNNNISYAYKDKIRSHRLGIFYRGLLVVVLIVVVVAASIIQYQNRTFSQAAIIATTSIPEKANANKLRFGDNIVTYSQDGIECIDKKGNALWNETFEMQNPIISVSDGAVAIGDYNGTSIYVENTAGSLGTINTNLPIRDLKVCDSGIVAAVLDDMDVTWIDLFDSAGNTIVEAKTSMNNSGYPISVSISPNGQLFMVSYVYVDSGEIKSSVAFYNFGEVGQNEVDRYVSGYDYIDSIVPLVEFMGNGKAFALADDRLMFYSGAQKPTSSAEVLLDREVLSAYHNSDYVGLVFTNIEGEEDYSLEVYNTNGQKVLTLPFDMDYREILFYEDEIIIYNDIDCLIYTMDGSVRYSGAFIRAVQLLVPTAKDQLTVVTSDSVDLLELKA